MNTTTLQDLQASVQVHNGVLTVSSTSSNVIANPVTNSVTHNYASTTVLNPPIATSPVNQVLPEKTPTSWKDMLTKNTPNATVTESQATVTHNKDCYATVDFSHEFLIKSQEQWNSSLIAHFIGGSFSFKFVKEQVLRL